MKILLIAYPSLKRDPRPFRQIKNLYLDHELSTIGSEKSGYEDYFYHIKKHSFLINFLRILIMKLGFYNWYYWDSYKRSLVTELNNNEFDLVIAHEIRLVPLALKLAKGKPIILDAHEYSPKNFNDDLFWRFFIKKYYTKLCEEYIPKVDKLISVSQGIVDMYSKKFNIDSILLTNKSEYVINLKPKKINKNKIKLLHHGNVSSSRKLSLLIDMMRFLDNDKYELTLILIHGIYEKIAYQKLRFYARGLNIKFINPVERSRLIDFSNNFDMGICFFPPTNFNLKYALPNKFFEFVQSRLAIVVGPDIEMSKYVKKYNLGVIAKKWTAKSLSDAIKSSDVKKLTFYKNQSHKYAKKLSSNDNDQMFKNIIDSFK